MGAMLRVAVLGRESQLPGTGAMLRVAVLGHESQLPGMGAMLRVAVLGHESQLPGMGAMLRVAYGANTQPTCQSWAFGAGVGGLVRDLEESDGTE